LSGARERQDPRDPQDDTVTVQARLYRYTKINMALAMAIAPRGPDAVAERVGKGRQAGCELRDHMH